MNVKLISSTPDPELTVARAARLCYRSSYDEKMTLENAQKLIREIVARGHKSVLEHASFTFLIEGISRAASHQLVRHRLASYSQQSQRYINFKNPEFVIPPSVNENKTLLNHFREHIQKSNDIYQEMIKIGIPEEDARYILPQAITSQIIITANAREYLHILQLRLCNRAQWEIRMIANKILVILKELAPTIFENAGPPCITGICPEGDKGCGHPWNKK
ncbi:MAG: FAD-dependent thymidylate synthase [Candidatus Atribacteria bacterium]|nr:FAD-dependent thymidylate synthase [Candidatus Atribacteria bacterium]